MVEGVRMVEEAPLEQIKAVYVSERFMQENRYPKLTEKLGGGTHTFETVADPVFRLISDTQTPQGIVKRPEYRLSDCLGGGSPKLLILESIQDPGNLGTMLRTGEGAGVSGVIFNDTTADLFNPKTIRSTMGSIYRVPFWESPDLKQTLEELKSSGIRLYAAHLNGTVDYDEPDYTGPCGFLIGNEGNGLSSDLTAMADVCVRIPMEGQVESLNAAVSAALFLYEAARQCRRKQ